MKRLLILYLSVMAIATRTMDIQVMGELNLREKRNNGLETCIFGTFTAYGHKKYDSVDFCISELQISNGDAIGVLSHAYITNLPKNPLLAAALLRKIAAVSEKKGFTTFYVANDTKNSIFLLEPDKEREEFHRSLGARITCSVDTAIEKEVYELYHRHTISYNIPQLLKLHDNNKGTK